MDNGNADDSDIVSESSVEKLKLLRNGTDLSHLQETPISSSRTGGSSSSSAVVSTISPSRRKLEQRIMSRISSLTVRTDTVEPKDQSSDTAVSLNEGAVKVLRLRHISNLVGSNEFLYQHGTVSALAVGNMIALGTSKEYIVIFDRQEKSHQVLQSTKSIESGPVTCVALSGDSTYVASGHANGDIHVWDVARTSGPVLTVSSLTQKDLAMGTREGHLTGSKIHQINFVGKRHTALISADNRGLLCYHNGYRNVLGYHILSRKILGKYSYDASTHSPILSTALLPLGTSEVATDDIGLTAIITAHALVVISIYPKFQTHFKVGKPSSVSKSQPVTACLAWLPALKSVESGSPTCPKLCYCWSNVLTVFDVNNEIMTNRETGEQNVFIKFDNKKRWTGKECLVAVQWLNDRIIAVLTGGHRLLLINESTMHVLSTVDLLGKNICSLKLFNDPLFNYVYTNSFKTLKNKVFLIGERDLYVTSLTNWSDSLLDLVNSGEYIAALELMRQLYHGSPEEVAVYGLPDSLEKRKAMFLDYVVKLISSTLELVFNDLESSYESDSEVLVKLLDLIFQIYVDFNGKISPEFFDTVFEKFVSFNVQDLFFSRLKEFIMDEKIVHLTPTVLKALVNDYISLQKGDELEELLCLLDISTLDIDLTISLCEQHHLRDSLTYIWNLLLNDYITPFFDFIKKIIEFQRMDTANPDKMRLQDEAKRVFGYISYILTGRQYPTERWIDFEKMKYAKQSLNYVLFSGASIAWPKGTGSKIHVSDDVSMEPAFPYLFLLLKFDFFNTLGALNEAFEDDSLNEEGSEYYDVGSNFELVTTRQYIIDILFEVFKCNKSEFSDVDETYLAIFVARNYPKFKQFITLSDTTCEELVETLCSYPDSELKEDCELSLQSLLSVYHPLNVNDLVYFFKRAGFYDVLFSLYRNEQQYHKVLEIWLANKERAQLEHEVLNKVLQNYENDSDIVRKCFELTLHNEFEKNEIKKFIRAHFKSLVFEDTIGMIKAFTRFAPDLHEEILHADEEEFAFKYLSDLYDNSSLKGTSAELRQHIKIRYVELLSKFDQEKLYAFLKESSTSEDLSSSLPCLRANRAIDSVVFMLESLGDYVACIKEIASHLTALKTEIIQIVNGETDFRVFTEVENDLWKYLFMAIKICDYELEEFKENDSLTYNEWAWLTVSESSVEILKAVNSQLANKSRTKSESYILDTVKRLLQDCFTNLINSRSADQTLPDSDATAQQRRLSFFNVFNQILNHSSSGSEKATRVSDVSLIIDEIFLSYKYDTALQRTILRLVRDRIFQEFEQAHGLRMKGLTSRKTECDACGKVLWGPYLTNDIYEFWKDSETARLMQKPPMDEKMQKMQKAFAITIFKCEHGFHDRCLSSLAGGSKKFCLICDE